MNHISGRRRPIKVAMLTLIAAAPLAAATIALPATANAAVDFNFHSPS
jgi:hypothetical protein